MTRNSLLTLAALAISGSLVFAQAPAPPAPAGSPAPQAAPVDRRPPNGMGRGMQGHPAMPGRGGPGNFQRGASSNRDGRPAFRGAPGGGFRASRDGGMMGGGFRIAPSGMWWKSPAVVQKLTLTPDQVKKMDDIFQQSRIQLIDLKANVEKQNVLLEPMLSANPPDTAKALAQIDKVAQARADLEKANAKMLLGIRGVLTPDQWTKLRTRGNGAAAAPAAPSQPGAAASGGAGRGPRGRGGDFVAPNPQP